MNHTPADLLALHKKGSGTMRRIRDVDGDTGTVMMMQVENEPGVLSTVYALSGCT